MHRDLVRRSRPDSPLASRDETLFFLLLLDVILESLGNTRDKFHEGSVFIDKKGIPPARSG